MDRNLLPALAAFAEVARAGSFTRAAAQMRISPSALSQIIRTLEKRLDVRLLNRSTRSVSVTEDGRRLLAEMNPGLAMITDAVGDLGASARRPTGELRINTSGFAAAISWSRISANSDGVIRSSIWKSSSTTASATSSARDAMRAFACARASTTA